MTMPMTCRRDDAAGGKYRDNIEDVESVEIQSIEDFDAIFASNATSNATSNAFFEAFERKVIEKDAASVWVDITPEYALFLLRRHFNIQKTVDTYLNRKVNFKLVDDYAKKMLNGEFIPTLDPVSVAVNNSLLNSQHRLLGIVKSGTTQRMCLALNVPKECQEVMDRGRSRSQADVQSISHPETEPKHIATLTASYDSFGGKWQTKIRNDILNRLLHKHENHLHKVIKMDKGRLKTNSIILGMVLRASYYEDHERLAEFVRIVNPSPNRMVKDPEKDKAAFILKNWVDKNKGLGGARAKKEMAWRALKAISYFCKGIPLSRFVCTEEMEYCYPIDVDESKYKVIDRTPPSGFSGEEYVKKITDEFPFIN